MNAHIVRSYDTELKDLRLVISKMGGLVETQIRDAAHALHTMDSAAAEKVQQQDMRLNRLEKETETTIIFLFARRAPVADDLREMISALKISNHLERVGDFVKNIARRTLALKELTLNELARKENGHADLPPIALKMAEESASAIHRVMDAYARQDAAQAEEVWKRDENLDNMHNAAYQEIIALIRENPENTEALVHMLMIIKNFERIGDKATQIAEHIYYTITGKYIPGNRPKNDLTSDAVANSAPHNGPE